MLFTESNISVIFVNSLSDFSQSLNGLRLIEESNIFRSPTKIKYMKKIFSFIIAIVAVGIMNVQAQEV